MPTMSPERFQRFLFFLDKTMKFRFHRGSLSDSMDTLAELQPTRAAIAAHMNRFPSYCATPLSIQVKPYGLADGKPGSDERIGWDTVYIVTDHTGVIGFTDGPVDK